MDEWEVIPRMYDDIIHTLYRNIPNITYDPSTKHIKIKKKDMIFHVTHPEEVKELMNYMWDINNFICRQYRRRKHILKSTELIPDA